MYSVPKVTDKIYHVEKLKLKIYFQFPFRISHYFMPFWIQLMVGFATVINSNLGGQQYHGKQYLSSQGHTANVYRQTTDKLMFISVISTVRWVRK